jgi:uncharacterized membrane protein YdbT with pleckstrin-like domain
VAFPRKLLHGNEEIVLDLRPHPWFLAEPFFAVFGAVILGGLVIAYINGSGFVWDVLRWGGVGLLAVCLVWFVIRYLKWITTNFVVTTDRLIFRSGLIAKQGVEIPLERINTVFFHQGVFERMIGAGDLSIESGGEFGLQKFSDIRKPSEVQNEIYRQMEANENRKFDRIGANIDGTIASATGSAAAAAAASIPEQIERLDDLRRKGLITEDEFAAKKAELLDRM